MQDITTWLQQTITESSLKDSEGFVTIQIPKGDYALQSLQIPKNSKIALFSGDRARLLFSGKRNRPMFVLAENAILVLREKIEIYYNTNNLQEVSKSDGKIPKEQPGGNLQGRQDLALFNEVGGMILGGMLQ